MKSVAVITGGTGSIGQATCARLLKDNWTVVLADVARPGALADGTHFQPVDVTSASSVATMFEEAAKLGTIGAVVNAHGVILETKVGEFDDDAVSTTIEINLKGVMRVCNAAVAFVADGGAIVLLSSVTAAMGRTPRALAYQATKGGVESLTRTLAVTLGPREVRVNAVAPGFVSVPMLGHGTDMRNAQGTADIITATPFGRLVTPAEIANTIAFLCSRDSSGISGVVIPVDGGELAV